MGSELAAELRRSKKIFRTLLCGSAVTITAYVVLITTGENVLPSPLNVLAFLILSVGLCGAWSSMYALRLLGSVARIETRIDMMAGMVNTTVQLSATVLARIEQDRPTAPLPRLRAVATVYGTPQPEVTPEYVDGFADGLVEQLTPGADVIPIGKRGVRRRP